MNRRKKFGYALLSAAFGIALSIPSAAPAQHKDGTPLKLGMVKAFFNDLPGVIIDVATQPFSELIASFKSSSAVFTGVGFVVVDGRVAA